MQAQQAFITLRNELLYPDLVQEGHDHMTDERYILRVENIKKSFGTNEVLKGVSINVRKGETICFIGPSGTGKSTLLRCINQLTIPDSGKIFLNDEEVTHAGPRINYFRQKIGMVFQNFFLFDHLTAVRNVEIALLKVKKMNPKEAREKAMYELKQVWPIGQIIILLNSLEGRPSESLLPGLLQWILISCSLMNRPVPLILN
jgi:ABC-type Fe3+/spermidine/putrescine transport system ATPase subunit